MAKIKLVEAERIFIPNVEFPTENGKENNRDLPKEDQVICEVELATIGEKRKNIGSYSVREESKNGNKQVKEYVIFDYEDTVSEKCKKITGLSDYGVTDGKTLVLAAKKYLVLNDVIQEVFFKINGIHEDDTLIGSDGGELTEGEE